MKKYIANNEAEYISAMEEILKTEQTSTIETHTEIGSKKTYIHSVVPLTNDIKRIYSEYVFNTKDIKDIGILRYSGTYAYGKFYEPEYLFSPYEHKGENFIEVTAEAATLTKKVNKYINDMLTAKYPTKESILEAIPNIETTTDEKDNERLNEYIKEEARELILKNSQKPTTICSIDDSYYRNLDLIIKYKKSEQDHKEKEFIKELAETYLSEKENTYNNFTRERDYTRRLYLNYLKAEAMDKLQNNMNEEDSIYLTIKERLNKLLEAKPNVKNVKIVLKGNNKLLSYRVGRAKRENKEFSIEGKEITGTYEVQYLNRYENNYKFFGFEFYPESPKVKDKYSNSSIRYIEDFMPSDILQISYGKNIIYQK